MMHRNNRLFCTIVPRNTVEEIVQKLDTTKESKIFVLDLGKEDEIALTYNIVKLPEDLIPLTVLCHRHKATRTLYTINALNTIIKQETGKVDKDYPVDWAKYQDSLLLVQNKELVQYKTKIIKIY